MKTYIIKEIDRIKNFSEKMDDITTLFNKTWVVYDDSGFIEKYNFLPDGCVFITNNGVGKMFQWHWTKSNESLFINFKNKDQVIMLRPEYVDDTFLAFRLDGTEQSVFFFEENQLKKELINNSATPKEFIDNYINRVAQQKHEETLSIEGERIRVKLTPA